MGRTTSKGSSRSENLTVVGMQWGDEGKGKLVDYLADGFDAVARFNGGSNAGHTVVIGSERHTFHLVPSGALKRKRLLIGAGVALDPVILAEELAVLKQHGVRTDVRVDDRCTLVSPMEKELDGYFESMRGELAIGTTRRGIGPSYAMRALRLTPRAGDLFAGFDTGPATKYYESVGLQTAGFKKWLARSRRVLEGILGDVGAEVDRIAQRGGSVLFEGSQGTLLDILHGSYPYVTSTQTIASYVPVSLGVASSRIGKVLGVAKSYTTRVGGGPFPTEIKGELGSKIRETGKEYGATTGRPRRVGWLDLVALRYAIRVNGTEEIALTKVDVLASLKELKVCVAYNRDGSELTDFQRALGHLGEVDPVYDRMPSLFKCTFGRGVASQLKRFVEYLEDALRVKVRLVSFGEDRSSTIGL
ncbi:MAG TPA: adenylosuccinate synthase [Nitrososphaerales archaeon]|nr:adenylosuccinate synthase [Nitrososphaerales archaeon]